MNPTISNTLYNISHQKTVIELLKSEKNLAFKEILPSKTINENIKTICYRDRIFSPDITIWTFLSQVLSEDYSCQAAVARVIAFFAIKGMNIPSSNTAAYSKARTRLPEEILPNLARSTAEQLEKETHKDWLWRGRKIKLIDGSTISMPDTPENQSIYPQP